MITVYFTQCAKFMPIDAISKILILTPVIPRIENYKRMLLNIDQQNIDQTYHTNDELFILVIQFLVRQKLIKNVTLISVCNHSDIDNPQPDQELVFQLDDDGDIPIDCHHGFFPQRLPLLR